MPTAQNHRLDGDLWIEVACSAAELAPHAAYWDDLATDVAEPNSFNERWFLQPAIEAFGGNRNLVIAFVYRKSSRQDLPKALVGLLALERTRPKGTIARRLSLFDHAYAFLLSPLIRSGHETAVWSALLDWAEGDVRCDMLDLPLIRGEGVSAQSLVEVLHDRGSLAMVSDSHARAILRRDESAERYIDAAIAPKQRREFQRLHRRLAEEGSLELRWLEDPADAGDWARQFLELEAAGWKGNSHTALAQTDRSRDFFETMIHTAAAERRLQALGLFLNGRPIAIKINFRCDPGSFAFKIAYDESFAKFSPGVQLELENIRQLHACPPLQWMDSCAAPGHPMINRLWRERTIIQHVLVSTGSLRGNLGVGLRPLVRAGRRLLSGKKPRSRPA